jgi:hypothetical protein
MNRSCLVPDNSISGLTVLGHVKGWWMEHVTYVASYWRFNDHRGQWTIQHNGCNQEQEWGLNRPFDESILLWHIATDLCFYQKGGTYDVDRVFMDAGSGINLIYAKTLRAMHISLEFLKPTNCSSMESSQEVLIIHWVE